jgi:hypothetical protein
MTFQNLILNQYQKNTFHQSNLLENATTTIGNFELSKLVLNLNSRPELSKGVVDFVASQEYIERPPVPLHYLFAIDVSYTSVSSGLLQLIINSIRRVLHDFPENSRIGIMTFDTTVHFYNLNVIINIEISFNLIADFTKSSNAGSS